MEIEKTADNIRVFFAAFAGIGAPTVTWFVEVEPYLKIILILGQITVAVFTALYIFTKWRKARKK